MQFGALGDIHGDFGSARRIMSRHPSVPFWLCVGDLADEQGEYDALPSPVYWIKGNNENFDRIAANTFPDGLRYLPNATELTLDGLRVCGLGGTFAPTWYDTPPDALPHPKKGSAKATELADKRRHFVRGEVEACRVMQEIDVFLSHEAARPFRVGRVDAGKTPINEILADMQPRLHLFGHHHRFTDQERHGVRSIGLDLVSTSYLLIDSVTMAVERHATTPH